MKKTTLLRISAAVLIIAAAGTIVCASMQKNSGQTAPAAETAYLTRLEYSYDQYGSDFDAIVIKREKRQGRVKLTAQLRDGSQKSAVTSSAVFDKIDAVMEKYQVSAWHSGKKNMEYIDGTNEEVYFRWSNGKYSHESAQTYPEGCGSFFAEVKNILEAEYRSLASQP